MALSKSQALVLVFTQCPLGGKLVSGGSTRDAKAVSLANIPSGLSKDFLIGEC